MGRGSPPLPPPYIGGQGAAPHLPLGLVAGGEGLSPKQALGLGFWVAGPLPSWASRMGPLGLGGAAGPRPVHCPFIPCGPHF